MQISLPVQSRMGFLMKSPGLSVNREYSHTRQWPLGWSRNWGWRLMVQLSSQEESFTVTMPPVTTPPVKGSRLQIFLI